MSLSRGSSSAIYEHRAVFGCDLLDRSINAVIVEFHADASARRRNMGAVERFPRSGARQENWQTHLIAVVGTQSFLIVHRLDIHLRGLRGPSLGSGISTKA